MAQDKTVIGTLYDQIGKMFQIHKNKIAADCASRPVGQKRKCKLEYKIMAYNKALPIVRKNISKCKNDIWNGEEKCRKKMTKVIKMYQSQIKTLKRDLSQMSAITPSGKPHMNSLQIDPLTQMILEKDNQHGQKTE